MAEGLAGGCFCGAVRYRLARPPMFIQCCHCTDCQQQSGGPFAINGMIERASVVLEAGAAEPVAVAMPTSSGRPHDVHRCPACHTALWSDYGRRRVMVFLRMMTLDDRAGVVPDAHIFTRSKLTWVTLPPGMRAFDIYYDMAREWPAESLARRAALLGAG